MKLICFLIFRSLECSGYIDKWKNSVGKTLIKIWNGLESVPIIGKVFRRARYPAKKLASHFMARNMLHWQRRITIVRSSPDNAGIPRMKGAGRSNKGIMVMHNGIKIHEGSYYGVGMAQLLRENDGVHEPQEERVFAEVLKVLKPNSHMIELGAYWGFYSLWFARDIPWAKCILVEPTSSNLDYGRENFALNGKTAEYVQAFVGASAKTEFNKIPEVTVDQMCRERSIDRLAILHSDIQGAEYEMLLGAEKMLSDRKVDFVFVSTHSEDLHGKVKSKLVGWGYDLITDVTPEHSYSEDGILVMKAREIDFKLPFNVSLR